MLRLHDDILSFGTTLHHATFAIKRAIVIKFVNKLKYIIVGLWLFALIWSTLPLIGWSGYAPEGELSVARLIGKILVHVPLLTFGVSSFFSSWLPL